MVVQDLISVNPHTISQSSSYRLASFHIALASNENFSEKKIRY